MKKNNLIILILFFVVVSCKVEQKLPLRIALSSSTSNYENWIHRADSSVIVIDLKGMQVDSALKVLSGCNGLLLTGGEDVVPAYYGKAADSSRCVSNPHRDSLEFALIHRAIKLKMPILGICRGEQILNVALGGTLLVDIPTDHPSGIQHKCDDYLKCFHSVKLDKSSNLMKICLSDSGLVTSNHHQAVDKVAPCFRAVAWSPDSIVEAIEYINPSGMPFLQAVQWHPERMEKNDKLSKPLVESFLKSARKK